MLDTSLSLSLSALASSPLYIAWREHNWVALSRYIVSEFAFALWGEGGGGGGSEKKLFWTPGVKPLEPETQK